MRETDDAVDNRLDSHLYCCSQNYAFMATTLIDQQGVCVRALNVLVVLVIDYLLLIDMTIFIKWECIITSHKKRPCTADILTVFNVLCFCKWSYISPGSVEWKPEWTSKETLIIHLLSAVTICVQKSMFTAYLALNYRPVTILSAQEWFKHTLQGHRLVHFSYYFCRPCLVLWISGLCC